MGGSQSFPGLTADLLEDYATLTYLSKGEILYLMKKFSSIDPQKIQDNFNHRFHKEDVIDKFHVLKINPFRDRIFKVFSSNSDDCFSFEDLLDLCSVMSSDCPAEVKAAWAFRIFDLDEDKEITKRDVGEILDRLIGFTPENGERYLDDDSKERIAKGIVEEISLGSSGGIGSSEFIYFLSRLPEFESSFYFRL